MIRFPLPATFVESLLTGSSIASQVDENIKARLITEASLELQPFVKNDNFSFPMGMHFAVARIEDGRAQNTDS
jgi:hypothetical protein